MDRGPRRGASASRHFRVDGGFLARRQARADLVVSRFDNGDRYVVQGGIANDVANGTVSITEGANGILAALIGLPGLKPINLEARAAGDRGAITIGFQLSAGTLRASGNGTISLADRNADIDFSVWIGDLFHLLSTAYGPKPEFSGLVTTIAERTADAGPECPR